MKIELTSRDIELILFLINDAVTTDVSGDRSLHAEEMALLIKLESALSRYLLVEKGALDPGAGDVYH